MPNAISRRSLFLPHLSASRSQAAPIRPAVQEPHKMRQLVDDVLLVCRADRNLIPSERKAGKFLWALVFALPGIALSAHCYGRRESDSDHVSRRHALLSAGFAGFSGVLGYLFGSHWIGKQISAPPSFGLPNGQDTGHSESVFQVMTRRRLSDGSYPSYERLLRSCYGEDRENRISWLDRLQSAYSVAEPNTALKQAISDSEGYLSYLIGTTLDRPSPGSASALLHNLQIAMR